MSSNYMFSFRRSAPAAPAAAPKAPKAPKAIAAPNALAAPNAQSDRFSLNRLMNYKATGGCRSCG
jgi:hypothetical protein